MNEGDISDNIKILYNILISENKSFSNKKDYFKHQICNFIKLTSNELEEINNMPSEDRLDILKLLNDVCIKINDLLDD
tara:strand:- start:5864 stop:6097 length:234 start_codon:yes stop_codon:yes gene_type:complete